MKKLILLITALAFAFACAGEPSKSANSVIVNPTKEQLAKAVPLNNTICPVTLSKIGSMGKAVQVIYKGKIVNLCCTGCPADFAKDPEKYMKVLEEKNNANSSASGHMMDMPQGRSNTHMEHHD